MFSENLTTWLIALSLTGWAFWVAVRLFSEGEEAKALWVGGAAWTLAMVV
jgi:hypothetical protein